jgi:glycosyltransferase involved in cell wall biosynthesis
VTAARWETDRFGKNLDVAEPTASRAPDRLAAGRLVAVPRVSIGMPVFNGERFLERTLDSLLGQTYTGFELVISDNGSTDRTRELCLAAAERDPRVRYHRSDENRGATWNFNRVFTLARGEYFKWAAYDDLCGPAFLELGVAALDRSPGSVLAYPRSRMIDEEDVVLGDHEDGLALAQPTPHGRLAALVPALGYTNPVYGVIRSSALRQTRLLGAYPSADCVLLAELALLGGFVEIPDRLFLRRIHPQMSRRVNPRASDAAVWFRPGPPQRYRAEAWRVFLEHFRSIARAPLPVAERGRCGVTFAAVGGRRYWDHLLREAIELGRAALLRRRSVPV